MKIMELLNTLYNLMGLVFVLGTVVSMGMSLTFAKITRPLQVLDAVTCSFSSCLHCDVLINENAGFRLLGNTWGVKRNYPDLTF
jgi:hypothetical protein